MKKLLITSLLICALAAPINVAAIDYNSPETIKQVQEALNAAGYSCGTPDGIIGNGTRNQIEKYRTDKGLAAGNAIDEELYSNLISTSGTDAGEASADENAISIHIDSEYGIIDFVRYELSGNDLFLVFDYQNTTTETTMPLFEYQTKLFQNGKEVSTGFSMSKPSDCDFGITEIRPGATLRYSVVYNLTELSPVELEVYPLYDFYGKMKKVVVIDFGSTTVAPEQNTVTDETNETAAPSAEVEELTRQLSEANARIAELETQLSEANAKVTELQGQLDAIKAAIGN